MNADQLFYELLAAVPATHKCKRVERGTDGAPRVHCFFGVPPDGKRTPLDDALPVETEGISFLGMPYEAELVTAFVECYHAQNLVELIIGNSSYASQAGYGGGLDYSPSVASLRGADLPRLRVLQLGVWELFHNAELTYGSVGDVADVLASTPDLTSLVIHGHFELTRSLSFGALEKLDLWSAQSIIEPQGGTIDPASFRNMLASDMPRLKKAELHPYCEMDQTRHAFPPEFLEGISVPSLDRLDVSGEELDAVALEQLLESPLLHRSGMIADFDEVLVSEGVDALRRRTEGRTGWTWEDQHGGGYVCLRIAPPGR